ncbi:MAG: hypothetical protein JG775_874 [Defluviitaleaceae bacterium]|nr:hypothetical protein [Defluviitaleaceae bacterium]
MMEDKDYVENDYELEEQDYFEREEQKRIKEELDALLRETNPLNQERRLTAEELENFYSLTARRKKKKRHSLKKRLCVLQC